ncbi:MAG: hypothetical protein AAF772_04865 [Acidobacteriota bacterium]
MAADAAAWRASGTALLLAALLLGAAAPARAALDDPDGWHRIEADDVVLWTDADVDRGGDLALRLALFRRTIAALSPALDLSAPAPMSIFAFRDARSYAPFRYPGGAAGAAVAGQLIDHPYAQFLTFDANPRRTGGLGIVYHEYLHSLARGNLPGVPRWFNEGLAEYYSTFAIELNDDPALPPVVVSIGAPVARHVRWLRDHDFDLVSVLDAWRDAPTAHGRLDDPSRIHDPSASGERYAVAWLLVHHLMRGSERLDQTAELFVRLAGGDRWEDAFERAYDLSLGQLQRLLEDDVAALLGAGVAGDGRFTPRRIVLPGVDRVPTVRLRPAHSSEVLRRLGALSLLLRRDDLTAQLLDAAPRDGDAIALQAFRLARDGRVDEADVRFADANAIGHDDALSVLLQAHHQLKQHRDQRGAAAAEAFAREALRRHPGYVEAHALLAQRHLRPGGTPSKGLEHVRKARARRPLRVDLMALAVDLHLRDEDPDAAMRMVEGPVRAWGPTELADRLALHVTRARHLLASDKALRAGDYDEALAQYDAAIEATESASTREQMETRLRQLQDEILRRLDAEDAAP